MALRIEDLEDQSRYRLLLKLPYDKIVPFVMDHIRKMTGLMLFFWSLCFIFMATAVIVRFNIAGYFRFSSILLHTFMGLILFPLLSIPVHELLHALSFLLTGARKIRVGMDLSQYIFYVSSHRHIVSSKKFWFAGLAPFILITITLIILIFILPGLWKWSLALFLFVHTTMCAGDFAILNFYQINRHKKILTWDDADEKMAYFYEEI